MMKFKLVMSFVLSFFPLYFFPANYPDWYLNPVKSTDKFFATGSANYKNEQLSIEAANIRARKEMSMQIFTYVSSMTKDYFGEKKIGDKKQADEFSQVVAKQISSTLIEGSKVEKIFPDRSTTPATYYILISIDVKDFRKAYENSLKANQKSITKLKDEGSFDDLVDEIDGLDAGGFISQSKKDASGMTEDKIKTGKAPDWINEYPRSGEYYIGIAQGKTLQEAKDSAINSLVSQIKVKIKSEINDYMKEVKFTSEEEVTQNIKLTVNESVEDLECYDLYYSGSKGYWAYYRLNIAQYGRKQAILVENARQSALDFLKKSLAENDPSLAVKYAFTGYAFIGKYISKNLKAEINGKEIIIVNELVSRIQSLLKNFVMTPDYQEIIVDRLSNVPAEFKFTAVCGTMPLANFPFKYSILKADPEVSGKMTTDAGGRSAFIIGKIKGNRQAYTLRIEPDLVGFLSKSSDDENDLVFIERVMSMGTPAKETTVKVSQITFNFNVEIKNNLDSDSQYVTRIQSMTSGLKNGLIEKMKASFSDYSPGYSMMFIVDGNMVQSGLSGQFFTRLIVTVKIIDNSNNNVIFSKATPEIKGGSVTGIKSFQASCDRYLKEYNDAMIEKIINFINN
jgi:hypothetical protein